MHRTSSIRLGLIGCLLAASPLYRSRRAASVFGAAGRREADAFKVLGVYGQQAGKEVDFVADRRGQAAAVDLHARSDPSQRGPDARPGSVCQPNGRRTAMRSGVALGRSQPGGGYLKQARQSLGSRRPWDLSRRRRRPGELGPESQGGLTVLVAKENRVTANFALVQPAMTDGPKILAEVAKLTGRQAAHAGGVGEVGAAGPPCRPIACANGCGR